MREPCTGCLYPVNDHLWEGCYSPANANGKREKHTVYAKTREECEALLAGILVAERLKIKGKKEQIKTG